MAAGLKRERGIPAQLLLACALAALSGCGRANLPAGIDPALAAFVPADTVLLAGVRVDELRGTETYRTHLERRLEQAREVDQLLLASDGRDFAVLARGKFTKPPDNGYRLLNSTTAIAGTATKKFIDARDRSTGGIPAPLREILRAIPPGHQAWMAASGGFAALDDAIPQAGNLSNLRRLLSFAETFTAAADLRKGVSAFATVHCRTDEDARSFAGAVGGFSALAGIGESVKTSAQGREARVELSMDAARLERLLNRAAQ